MRIEKLINFLKGAGMERLTDKIGNTNCVKAWMKLPKPYEPRLKEFGGRDSGN